MWCQPIVSLHVVGWSEFGSRYSEREALLDRRNSNRCDNETRENSPTSKVEDGKKLRD